MTVTIDLNCDLGEYDHLHEGDNDAAIMPFISSCNVACGEHAGNRDVIEQTVRWAIANQVSIGAHPSYPDKQHFGRRVMNMPAAALRGIFLQQINTVCEAVRKQQARLSHVKPHGALYNQAARDKTLSLLLMEAVADYDADLLFYGLAHSATAWAAEQVGVKFVAEGFADRGYTDDRMLQARNQPGALITNAKDMLQRAINMLKKGQIVSVTGNPIGLNVTSLCLHGDHDDSLQTAITLNQGLLKEGIEIKAPGGRAVSCD